MSIAYSLFAERLARGQLKNTAAVEETNLGEICPDYAATILSLTNQGLVDISTRLPLIRKLIDLTFVTDQFVYPLNDASALYLDDSLTETFVEEAFVKVLDIYDSTGDLYLPSAGKRYEPNTNGHITTPTFDSIRFSAAYIDPDNSAYIGPKIRIQYQAKHLEITADDDIISLPPNLVAALQLYVAAQYISDMGGKEQIARGDGYMALYLRHVGEDVLLNTSGTSEVENQTDRFTDSGWV